jgi:hypothetical protein
MALIGPKHVVMKGKYSTSLYTCHNRMYILQNAELFRHCIHIPPWGDAYLNSGPHIKTFCYFHTKEMSAEIKVEMKTVD